MRVGSSPVLLVPSEPDARRARDELCAEFPVGLRVTTLDQYSRQAWDLAGDGRQIVSAAQREMLIAASFGPRAVGRGYVRLATRAVERLADETGTAWRRANTRSLSKLTEAGKRLADVLVAYSAGLDRLGMIEPAEAQWLLAEAACPNQLLVVHRFTDFARAQEAMLTAWARAGAEVLFTLPWEPHSPATVALDPLIGRLDALGAVRITIEPKEFATAPELRDLGRALFRPEATITPTGAVRLLTAEGPRAEAVAIAAEVLEFERSGIPGEQIGVVFRRPEEHHRHLRQAFAESGISADFDVNMQVHATPYGHAVVSLLDFGLYRRREDLLRYLASAYGGIDLDELSALETRWRRRGVVEHARLLRELGDVSRTARTVAEMAIACCRAPVDGEGALGWNRLLDVVFQQGTNYHPQANMSEGDTKCLGALQRVLADIVGVPDMTVAPADLVGIMRNQTVPAGEVERPGRVQVGSVIRMRSRRFQAIVLGGMAAGEFPAPSPEDMMPGGVVSDVLAAFGSQPQSSSSDELERLLFAQCVSAAREHLTLSYSGAASDGSDARPSTFLDELLDAYRDQDGCLRLEAGHQAIAEVPGASCGSQSEREQLRACAYQGDTSRERIRAARLRLEERVALIESDQALEKVVERDAFSPSELETYLACPYRWFLERCLRPDSVDRTFGAAEQGEFAHQLLSTFYQMLSEAGVSRMSPSTLARSERVIPQAYDTVVARIGPAGSGREEFERREALRWVNRIIKEDAEFLQGFEPRHLEWEFGDASPGAGGYQLRGRVDRIDVDSEGKSVIVDYKRSSGPAAAEIASKGKIQLPLYMSVVAEQLGLEVVGGLYRGLRNCSTRGLLRCGAADDSRITSTDVLGDGDFEEAMERALELAEQAVCGIRSGLIARQPRHPQSCAGCSAALACSGRTA